MLLHCDTKRALLYIQQQQQQAQQQGADGDTAALLGMGDQMQLAILELLRKAYRLKLPARVPFSSCCCCYCCCCCCCDDRVRVLMLSSMRVSRFCCCCCCCCCFLVLQSALLRLTVSLLSSAPPSVAYEGACCVLSLCPNPLGLRAACGALCQLLLQQTEHNIKLIVLDRIQECVSKAKQGTLSEFVVDLMRGNQ